MKRLIGCLHDDPDIESEKENLIYNFARGANGEIEIKINCDNEVSFKHPEEIAARILRKLKQDAEKYLQEKIKNAVITVPAYFNNNQRAATRDAAKIAGLEVLKLLNEPSAAALAYIHKNPSAKERIILIYDLGGGTFDVSIVRTHSGRIQVLSVAGDTHLGGQDFLHRLVKHVTNEIESKYKIKIRDNKLFMNYLVNTCEKKKKQLTTAESVFIETFLPQKVPDSFVKIEITRGTFEKINDDLFNKTIIIVDTCIRNRRLNKSDIDEVLLVGGSSRIPKIESLLKQFFNNKVIQRNINADEAIAVGAAIEADYIAHHTNDTTLIIDVLPLSIGTVINEETIVFNFARNTPLPANSKQICNVKVSRRSNQGSILSVYEGDHVDCNKNVLLGAHEIRWIKQSSVKRTIEITMQINTNGIIWVTARGDTIKTFSIALNKGRFDDEEIKSIMEEIEKGV